VDNSPDTVDNLGNTADTPDEANMSEAFGNVRSMTSGLVETHLLKTGEVRDLLHIGRTTLWEWRRDGRIRGIQHHPKGPWYYPADQPVIEAALRAVGSIR
jgi:hypothetical protein